MKKYILNSALDNRKKKVLVINVYFPEVRRPIQLTNEIPNTLAPVFIAGAFADDTCAIQIYNEVNSGFIEVFHPELLEWPDVVVFTGLTFSFDRIMHLSAYFKDRNEKLITIAGGQAVRTFRNLAARIVDYVCLGDVEELTDLITSEIGKEYAAEQLLPRYDLAYWMKSRIGYVESSRNCNFKCAFCSLTGEGVTFQKKNLDYLRYQIKQLKKVRLLYFLDNQFYGNDKRLFREKLELLKELRKEGYFQYWAAILTNDFFWDDELLALAKESGCFALFVGVESFDSDWLEHVNKKQNNKKEQLQLIKKSLDAGILFQFGLVYDPSERPITSMKNEIAYINSNSVIPTPLFFFTAIPFPGTPFFQDKYEAGLILPNTKVRDLESSTLSLRPGEDSIEDTAEFIRRTKYFEGYRRKMMGHELRFLLKNNRSLNFDQKTVSMLSTLRLFSPSTFSNLGNFWNNKAQRTHISSTEILDSVYTPVKRVSSKYQAHFEPTYITNAAGELNDRIAEDLTAQRYKIRKTA
ncbi:MAG: radical SAM protein [Cytophagales bacterium]|nr:radical SAM protein [Cytophagales bacterium]